MNAYEAKKALPNYVFMRNEFYEHFYVYLCGIDNIS